MLITLDITMNVHNFIKFTKESKIQDNDQFINVSLHRYLYRSIVNFLRSMISIILCLYLVRTIISDN